MPHLLEDLNGAKKHIFSIGEEKYFLRVFTTPEEYRKYPESVQMVAGPIMRDAQKELQNELDRRGDRQILLDAQSEEFISSKGIDPISLNRFLPPTKAVREAYAQEMPNYLGGSSNGTIFVIENELGNPACGIYITINDEIKRQELKVSPDIKTFVYVSDILTEEKYRGKNIFSSAFDKIMTMLANPKRETSGLTQYAVSVTAAMALKESGETISHVLNLPRYYKMWDERFEDLSVNKRWQDITTRRQMAVGDPVDVKEIFGEEKIYDEERMGSFIDSQRAEASLDGKRVRGAFLSGKLDKKYPEIKKTRSDLMERRAARTEMSRDKSESEVDKSWQRPSTAFSAVAVATKAVLKESDEKSK